MILKPGSDQTMAIVAACALYYKSHLDSTYTPPPSITKLAERIVFSNVQANLLFESLYFRESETGCFLMMVPSCGRHQYRNILKQLYMWQVNWDQILTSLGNIQLYSQVYVFDIQINSTGGQHTVTCTRMQQIAYRLLFNTTEMSITSEF